MKIEIIQTSSLRTIHRDEFGNIHRDYGPAVTHADGTMVWYVNGQRHRFRGPAVEYADGSREWFFNGMRHRLDGPAIENISGRKYWFVYDQRVTEAEFKELQNKYCKSK